MSDFFCPIMRDLPEAHQYFVWQASLLEFLHSTNFPPSFSHPSLPFPLSHLSVLFPSFHSIPLLLSPSIYSWLLLVTLLLRSSSTGTRSFSTSLSVVLPTLLKSVPLTVTLIQVWWAEVSDKPWVHGALHTYHALHKPLILHLSLLCVYIYVCRDLLCTFSFLLTSGSKCSTSSTPPLTDETPPSTSCIYSIILLSY